jgi:hypothetical protein
MGVPEHEQTVRGSNGTLRTNASGVIQTDNYAHGAAFDFDGSTYPYSLNPAETIQELNITASGDIIARITTTGSDTFDLPLASASASFGKWEIDSVEFRDPHATGARIAGGWAGE